MDETAFSYRYLKMKYLFLLGFSRLPPPASAQLRPRGWRGLDRGDEGPGQRHHVRGDPLAPPPGDHHHHHH